MITKHSGMANDMSKRHDEKIYGLERIVRLQTEASWQMLLALKDLTVLLALKDLTDGNDARIAIARDHLRAADELLRSIR